MRKSSLNKGGKTWQEVSKPGGGQKYIAGGFKPAEVLHNGVNFKAPADGYVRLYCAPGAEAYIVLNGAAMVQASGQTMALFVKKGITINIAINSGTEEVTVLARYFQLV